MLGASRALAARLALGAAAAFVVGCGAASADGGNPRPSFPADLEVDLGSLRQIAVSRQFDHRFWRVDWLTETGAARGECVAVVALNGRAEGPFCHSRRSIASGHAIQLAPREDGRFDVVGFAPHAISVSFVIGGEWTTAKVSGGVYATIASAAPREIFLHGRRTERVAV